jgi:hypothetical protein
MSANRNGKRINSTVVISVGDVGKKVVVLIPLGRKAEARLEQLGWTQDGNLWRAPAGWQSNDTILFTQAKMMHGKMLYAYTYFDRDSDRDLTVCPGTANESAADTLAIKMGWKREGTQWVKR